MISTKCGPGIMEVSSSQELCCVHAESWARSTKICVCLRPKGTSTVENAAAVPPTLCKPCRKETLFLATVSVDNNFWVLLTQENYSHKSSNKQKQCHLGGCDHCHKTIKPSSGETLLIIHSFTILGWELSCPVRFFSTTYL